MKDEQIKSLIKEVLQEENMQRTKALQKEKAMRTQMYKDSISTAVGIIINTVLISFIPIFIIFWAGFNFLTGVVVTVFAALIVVITYASIKDDNETREERVNKILKKD